MDKKKITVTSPLIPSLKVYNKYLEDIWKREWLTNNGYYHNELENKLCKFLDVPFISLFANGTLALVTALQLLDIEGEVITTPYSFVATSHAIWWNNLKPVFVDIDPVTLNMDPQKIERAITSNTKAILPVHVYGTPCNHKEIKAIADRNGLKVIYDAAHAFAVKENGKSILNYGDLSILSFHATKTYSTIEGGAIICKDAETKRKIDLLKNFGFNGETEVIAPGINAKMNEVQAAYGLANLDLIEDAILHRKAAFDYYREQILQITGLSFLESMNNVEPNYSYFPIFVNENDYGISRDELYNILKANNIFGRRYFYPLITSFSPYDKISSASDTNLPIANKIAREVICLPMHHKLTNEDIIKIVQVLKNRS